MLLSSRNKVILIVLALFLQSTISQSLQQKIEKLPACSNNCIAAAATAAGCAADDFACQCQKSESLNGILGSVLGSVTSQNQCLVGDCGIVTATSAQVIFKQICGLINDNPTSSTSAAPTTSTAAAAQPAAEPPPETTTLPPPPETSVDFTAPPATSTSTSSTATPVPVISSTTSVPPTTSSTPIPTFTLSPQTSLQSTTSIPPLTTTSVPPSPSSTPVTSSSSSLSTDQASLPASSTFSVSSTSSSSTTSIPAALLASPSITIDHNETRILPSTSPTGTSYQAEANQSTPIAQKMTTNRMPPAIIAGIVLGVLSFVILCTFIMFLFRRRQQSIRKKRAISTMTAMSRKSGEEITIYLDLGEEGRNYEGVAKKKVEFRESELGYGGGSRITRLIPAPLNLKPRLQMVESDRGFNFKSNLSSGLNSFRKDP